MLAAEGPEMARVRDKADKQARIAEAARALFDERGFDGTTIRAIAARAGVATGTVLLYGHSKAELLVRLFVDELEDVIAARTATLDPTWPLSDRVIHLLMGFLERYAERPALSRVYVKETLFVDDSEQYARYIAVTERFLAGLTALIDAEGDAVPLPAPTAAAAIFGLYLLHVAQLLRDAGDVGGLPDVRASLTAMVRQLLGG
jgi:AcrR family transcriptional regulator